MNLWGKITFLSEQHILAESCSSFLRVLVGSYPTASRTTWLYFS